MERLLGLINSVKNCKPRLIATHVDALVFHLNSKAEVGLENEELKIVLTLLTCPQFQKSSNASFKKLLIACVPKASVSGDVIDIVLLWLLSMYSTCIAKVNALLEWLTGLLDFNIVDRQQVDSYYNLYYGLLNVTQLQKRSCFLLYQLTRPEDVYRGRVEKVYHLHLQNGKAKHTSTLLGMFKMFKPEMVPEDVSMFNTESAFGKLNSGLESAFTQTLHRVTGQADQVYCNNSGRLEWKGVTSSKSGCIIPSASYVHVGSKLYREKKRRVIEFLDKESLACSQLRTELPSCILSLLLNEGGVHLLATHNSDIHARFSFALFSTLNSAFITNQRNYKYNDRDLLLQKIIDLEDYMQQGIPVVSRFLALYIAFWNGLDHREHIYKLLEQITFSSFEDFSFCILGNLQTLFLSAATSEKCKIINTLRKLIFNLTTASGWLLEKKIPKKHLFLGNEVFTTDFNDVSRLINVVADLCHQGLLLTLNCPTMLHTALCFYESLLDMQVEACKDITVIPPFTFYRAVFSQHFSAFSRACNLLVRYKDLVQDGRLKGLQYVKWLNDYSCDIWNCFITNKAFMKGKQGFVFQTDGNKLLDLSERDGAFSLGNNLISSCLKEQLKEIAISKNLNSDRITSNVVEQGLWDAFPATARCLDEIKKMYANYH